MIKADLVGKKFGKLEVKEETRKGKNVAWLCKCDCGNETISTTNSLLSGRKASCGCYRKEFASKKDSAKNKLFASYKNTAKNKGIVFDLCEDDFFMLTKKSCFYCGVEPKNIMKSRSMEYVYNGIDRIDSSRGYSLDNCVPCCSTCNYAKRNLDVEQFLQWVKRIYITQYRKVTDMTPGQLIDLLFTTNYKCWWAQEDIYKYKDIDPEKSAEAAYRAQELNAKRTKLIRTIDRVLDFSENTNTEKTYSDGNEKDNYTYFKDKK